MKKYKVLMLVNGGLLSPYQNYIYGNLEDVLGKKLVCENFDDNEYNQCSDGFYATDVDGLIYSLNKHKDNRVFEVEVGGRSVIHNKYKQRFEEQTIIRMLPKTEVKKLIKEQSKEMDWDYYHACYPVNPLKINKPFDKEKASKLLKEWNSAWVPTQVAVWDSVSGYMYDFVGNPVWDSMWNSLRDSASDFVWDSVLGSVWTPAWDSMWAKYSVRYCFYAYISSLFSNTKKWKYINNEEGVNPFQSGIDLWHMGLVPSFDGKVWRLYKGENAEVVLEITREELGR